MEVVRIVERKFRWFLLIAITISGAIGLPYWLPLMLPAHAAAPTMVLNSAAQKTDGSGAVDVSVTVNDSDGDDTLKIRIGYKSGSDCSSPVGLTLSTIDTTDSNTTATYGDPKVDNAETYRIGTAAGWITTSSGANTVQFDWLSATDLPTGDGTYCLRAVVNDGTSDGTVVTTSLTIDNVDPATPGDLAAGTITTSSIVANFGSQSSDTNFSKYRMFYLDRGQGGMGELLSPTNGIEHNDANLLAVNYNSASNTTLTSLNPNAYHEIGIWAYDTYGNYTGNAVNLYKSTLANTPTAPTVTVNSTTALNVSIGAGDSNPSYTGYAIYEVSTDKYVKSDGTLGSGATWLTSAGWGTMAVAGLTANTQYTFKVKARNLELVETDYGATTSHYTLAGQVAGLSVSETTDKSNYKVSLSWTNPTPAQTGAKIQQDTNCDGSWDTTVYNNAASVPASPYSISGLSAGTCYKFRVSSYNGSGDENTTSIPESANETTGPAAPAGLTASIIATDSITWDWNDVSGATSYNVYSNYDDSLVKSGADSQWLQNTVSAASLYVIYVRAVNANGEGIASSTASASPDPSTPASLTHSAQSTSSITWGWSSAIAQAGYWARAESPVGNAIAAVADWITDLFWAESSLSANQLVTLYVKAKNAEADESSEASTQAYAAQNAPSGITFGTIATDSIALTADGTFPNLTSGSSGIYFSNGTTSLWQQNASWTNGSLSPNTQYTYTVKARNGDGDETATASSSKYTLANIPGTPTVSVTSSTSLTVVIDVNSNPAATTLAIQDVASGNYVQVSGALGASAVWQTYSTWGGAAGIAVSGLTPNTSYQFKVKARNGDSTETALSSASTAKYTLANVPTSLISTGVTTNSIALSWSANSNPAGTEFYVTNSTTGANSGWITDTSYTFSSLSASVAYTFNVKARNSELTETAASADYTKSTNPNPAPLPLPPAPPAPPPPAPPAPPPPAPPAPPPPASPAPPPPAPPAPPPPAPPAPPPPAPPAPPPPAPPAPPPPVPPAPPSGEPEQPEPQKPPEPEVPQPQSGEPEAPAPSGAPEGDGAAPTGEPQGPAPTPSGSGPVAAPILDVVRKIIGQIKDVGAPVVEESIKIAKIVSAKPNSKIRQQMVKLKQIILDNIDVQRANDVVQVPVLVATSATAAATLATTIGSIANYLQFLITQPVVLWYRRRKKEWGVVYDSITKRPVDLAVVRVFDAKTNQLLQTRVTDKNGRYNFVVDSGEYYIVVQKQEYAFPSALLNEMKADERYTELYYGKPVTITEKKSLAMNIPLDPDKKMVTNRQVVLSHIVRKAQYVFLLIGPTFAAISLAINPKPWVGAILVAHLVGLGLFLRVVMPQTLKYWGMVKSKDTDAPLKRAVTRVFDSRFNKLLDTQITDSKGRYSFLVGNNIYYVTAEKNGFVPRRSDFIDLRRSEDGGFVNLDMYLNRQHGEAIDAPQAEAAQVRKLEKEAPIVNKETTVAGVKVGDLHEEIRDIDYIK
jgi:hypothetical protein